MRRGQDDLQGDLSRRGSAILLLAVLVGAAGLRARLLSVPLERDEGEYAYIGSLMLEGVPPYSEAYTMKLPGIHAAYAGVLALFGQSTMGIRLGLLGVNLAAIALVFLVGRELFGRLGGVCAGAAYAVLSLGAPVHGFIANAEHFVLVPALGGVWLLLRADRGRRVIVGAGLCFGLAFLVKQPAIAFLAFGVTWLGWTWMKNGFTRPRTFAVDVVAFLCGPVILFAATCLWMKVSGSFDSFWRWTVEYPRGYLAQVSWWEGADQLLRTGTAIVVFAWPVLLLALAGVYRSLSGRVPMRGAFVFLFGLFSFLAVCPGLHFREHYFLLFLPSVALAIGSAVGLSPGPERRGVALSLAVVSGCLSWSIFSQRDVLFRLTPVEVSQFVYGLNPFVESPAIAAYIQKTTSPESRVAILGSEPQILFHARRRSATGFLYMYPLTEDHAFTEAMQRQLIAEIEGADPEVVVVVAAPMSWLYRASSPRLVLDWMNEELPRGYDLEAVVPIGEGGRPRVFVGEAA